MPRKRVIPKGCIVHRVKLDDRGALVRFRCGDEGGGKMYPQPDGGMGTYPAKRVKGVSHLSIDGTSIEGNADVGFVLAPRSAVCWKDGRELACEYKLASRKGYLPGRKR